MKKLYYDPQSLNIGGNEVSELRHADDTLLLSTTTEGLGKLIESVKENNGAQNLYLNAKKTKIMPTDKSQRLPDIKINGGKVEVVNEYQYLGTRFSKQ